MTRVSQGDQKGDTRPSRERDAVGTERAGKTYSSYRGFPIWEAPEALRQPHCVAV